MVHMTAPVIAKVSLSALRHNCRQIRKLIPESCKMCVAVKCNAYGHGTQIVLPVLVELGVDMLAVATIDESMRLRNVGWKKPVLLLGSEFSIYKGKEKTEIADWLVCNNVRIVLMNQYDLKSLSRIAEKRGIPARVHLKVDSGMSRMGLQEHKLVALAAEAQKCKNILIEGLFTHFASADKPGEFSEHQIQQLLDMKKTLVQLGITVPLVHAANSAAITNLNCWCDMVRPGLAVYGYDPGFCRKDITLVPCMRVLSYLTLVKKIKAGDCVGYGCSYKASRQMTIGIVPIGYGDGYDRRLSNRGIMMVNGIATPVLGKINMDQTVVD
jgi:alanine racemase